MKNLLAAFFALVILILTTESSLARTSTMRCGNRLVRAGDTKGEVLAKCGEPALPGRRLSVLGAQLGIDRRGAE